MLTFDRVSFAYRADKPVLTDVSFRLADGEYMTVMGESGCGKSTLLSLASGILKPTSGRIECNTDKICCVFQEPRLFPWLTVAENLAVVMKKQNPAEIAKILQKVELSDCVSLYPSELSGGMKSRVSLARGLLYGGDLFLLDEPFSALDAPMRHRLTDLLKQHLSATHASAILVTHQKDDARRFGGKILQL